MLDFKSVAFAQRYLSFLISWFKKAFFAEYREVRVVYRKNRNGYARMIHSIEYATGLHAHDKRLKRNAIARVSDYPSAARISRASRVKSGHLSNRARREVSVPSSSR